MKDVVNNALGVLEDAANSILADYEAGDISWPEVTVAIGAAIETFLGSISLGWVATAVLTAAALYFADQWANCIFMVPDEPTPLVLSWAR